MNDFKMLKQVIMNASTIHNKVELSRKLEETRQRGIEQRNVMLEKQANAIQNLLSVGGNDSVDMKPYELFLETI